MFDTLYPVATISKIVANKSKIGNNNDSITVHRTQDLSDDVFFVSSYNVNLEQAMSTIQKEWNSPSKPTPTNFTSPSLDSNAINNLFSQVTQMAQGFAAQATSNMNRSSPEEGNQMTALSLSDEVKKELEVD